MATNPTLLQAERQHLANLLEQRKTDPALFEPLAAVNKRFETLARDVWRPDANTSRLP
ncbi:MAG: hypothetical protein Q8M09_03845 [Pseudomonadota bacterium]|nr:hypothetical protein [Pseudomonadota bacterium]MDP1903370.1 hypothetical protein [Pseudomonadota bacterium]MDP2352340.1 hypothetical protein [Pseudomonadota bacterium]